MTIKELCKIYDISMSELARKCGLKETYFINVVNTNTKPSINNIFRIANALGLYWYKVVEMLYPVECEENKRIVTNQKALERYYKNKNI